MKSEREIALTVGLSFLGKPYIWGGRTPIYGFDCSGFVAECLRSVGLLGFEEDLNSEGLRQKFEGLESKPVPGALLFWDWDNEGRARHVEMIVSVTNIDEVYTIGASGGDILVKNPARADVQKAFVKVRPARPDAMVCLDPFLHLDDVIVLKEKNKGCESCES